MQKSDVTNELSGRIRFNDQILILCRVGIRFNDQLLILWRVWFEDPTIFVIGSYSTTRLELVTRLTSNLHTLNEYYCVFSRNLGLVVVFEIVKLRIECSIKNC